MLPRWGSFGVADGRLRTFARTRVSPYTPVITWAPAEQIAYLPMNRDNVKLLDPASGIQRDILLGTYATHGFVFDPKYLSDGKRLKFNWARGPGDGGPWIFDLQDSSFTRLSESVRPRGSSAEHRYIYQGFPTIERIDTWRKGARHPVMTVPVSGDGECLPAGPRLPGAFVCLAINSSSDVWMIENFDPRGR